VLVHTQDPALARVIEASLVELHAAITAEHGPHRRNGAPPPHLALVDLGAARSIETIRGYALDGARVPVIAIGRSAEAQARLSAFANGADDVITLPILNAELVARVRALLRRAYGDRMKYVPSVKVGDLEIDVMESRIRCGDQEPPLTSTEQAILFVLASHAGSAVSRETIRKAVWGATGAPPSNIVDRHVRSLRSKLGDSWRAPRYIATIRQQGYRLAPP